MKIQGLAVLAIVIILPMSIILNSYSSNQIKTLDFQISYDTRLLNSTYDGIKAIQLNMSNSSTSNIADSKMRDIKASIKTFYNSLASNFSMSGYGEDVLQNYVPAVVYTLYDGYYIYSDYKNTLDEYNENTNPEGDSFYRNATYKNGEDIYGLKPYIYYSCRYKSNDFDVVITYSLDSYVRIQGKIDDKVVNEAGYLLSGVDVDKETVSYRGIEIQEENTGDTGGLRQNVSVQEVVREETAGSDGKRVIVERKTSNFKENCPYKKINGTKYYYDEEKKEIFSSLDDEKILFSGSNNEDVIKKNDNAKKFYEKANEFKNKFNTGGNLAKLKNLSTKYAIDVYGKYYKDYGNSSPYSKDIKIFEELLDDGKLIEDENSNFNRHRKEVIKNSIESNLIVAIANYNKVSTSDVKFAMPRLKDEEWDELTTNISMITFLQGLNIGGKVYSGYAIVPNDINEDFVSEDSLYITVGETYYRVTDEKLLSDDIDLDNAVGFINTDFEMKTIQEGEIGNADKMTNKRYFPRTDEGSYTSIIELNSKNGMESLLKEKNINAPRESPTPTEKQKKLAQIYYTALGRERYGMFRVNNPFPTTLEP